MLRHCIDKGFVVPYFQPVVDIRSGQCHGAEVLARVMHPVQGLLLPADFILPHTGEDDLALLTRTLMQQAGQSLPAIPDGQEFMLSFNITPARLTAPWLPGACTTLCQMTGPGLTVVLELTEQRRLTDATGDLHARLALLRRAGVRLALDDFGTGWSGLALLLQTGADILKIPREFVSEMAVNPRADRIIDSIIRLADSLGMEVIAEGVEQRFQAERLVSHGVCLFQGAYYSMPLSGEALTDYLTRSRRTQSAHRGDQEALATSVRGAVTECAHRHALSLRETEVLILLARGQSLSELARETNRSTKTCSVQKRSAYRKMGIRSDVEFMHYLYRIIDIPPVISARRYDTVADIIFADK
ncbi:TPA: EAL domain-containing protein [Citrobacter freundii]|nr:EAL domain-containing protein [Citrobacter freundii]